MNKKYFMQRLDLETNKLICLKKQKLENAAKEITGKIAVRIPKIKIINLMARHSLYLDDDEVRKLTKWRRI